MISGNPNRRDFDKSDPNDKAISYVCLDYSGAHRGTFKQVSRSSG